MSKNRLIITAVILEGRSQATVARDYNVSKSWVSKLISRYKQEGEAAFEPRSRRPHTSPRKIPGTVIDQIIQLGKHLAGDGLDAGPDTIAWHLTTHHNITISPATISRHLTQAGLVAPEPKKKPKSSYIKSVPVLTKHHHNHDKTVSNPHAAHLDVIPHKPQVQENNFFI